MERKLAAILAADVVAYDAHRERDEIGAHEFNSVVDAVDCAGGFRRHSVGDVR
jgi:hypothetical protein